MKVNFCRVKGLMVTEFGSTLKGQDGDECVAGTCTAQSWISLINRSESRFSEPTAKRAENCLGGRARAQSTRIAMKPPFAISMVCCAVWPTFRNTCGLNQCQQLCLSLRLFLNGLSGDEPKMYILTLRHHQFQKTSPITDYQKASNIKK